MTYWYFYTADGGIDDILVLLSLILLSTVDDGIHDILVLLSAADIGIDDTLVR